MARTKASVRGTVPSKRKSQPSIGGIKMPKYHLKFVKKIYAYTSAENSEKIKELILDGFKPCGSLY